MLRVAVIPASKCTIYDLKSTSNCTWPGKENEITNLLLSTLGISYDVVSMPHEIGVKIGTKWVGGMLGALQNGSVDALAAVLWQTPQLSDDFHFTDAIIEDQIIIEIGKSKSTDIGESTFLMLKPFEWSIWIQNLLFASLLRLPEKELYSDPWKLLEAMDNGQMTLIRFNTSQPVSLVDKTITESQTKFGRLLRKALNKHPPYYIEYDYSQVDQLISTGKYAFISYVNYVSKPWFENNCKGVEIANVDLTTFRRGYIFRKNSSLTDAFNKAIITKRPAIENTLEKYKDHKIEKMLRECAHVIKQKRNVGLSLPVFFGPLNSLAVATVVGVACLFIERRFNVKTETRKAIGHTRLIPVFGCQNCWQTFDDMTKSGHYTNIASCSRSECRDLNVLCLMYNQKQKKTSSDSFQFSNMNYY